MDFAESSRRRRRRGPRRRVSGATIETLPPGRAPIGLFPAATTTANICNVGAESETPAVLPHSTKQNSTVASQPLSIQDKLQRLLSSIETEQPEIFQPLLSAKSKSMSTLGSQARAAEYAAATAAKARQFSREAEEQKLPPKAKPVSLSAFTRGQQPVSRNKGNKTWKPLTEDDLDGEDFDDFTPCNSRENTPSRVPDENAMKQQSRQLLNRPAHADITDVRIPCAPRAMRMLTRPVIKFLPQQLHPALEKSPGSNQKVTPPNNSRTSMAAYCNVRRANDGSPGGQQLLANFNELQDRQNYPNVLLPPLQIMPPGMTPLPSQQGVFNDNPLRYFDSNFQDPYSYGPWLPAGLDVTPPTFPSPCQGNMGIGVFGQHIYQSAPPAYVPRLSNLLPPAPALYNPEYRKPEQSYDRARIMETYKASLTKEVLERKGKTKTVLHNPELHKAQSPPQQASKSREETTSDVDEGCTVESSSSVLDPWENPTATPSPQEKTAKPELHLQPDVFAGKSSEAVTVVLNRPPPGLSLPVDGPADKRSVSADGNVPKLGAGLPDSFFKLGPMSDAELENIGRCAAKARDDLTNTEQHPMNSSLNDESMNEARARYSFHWFHALPPFEDFGHRNAFKDQSQGNPFYGAVGAKKDSKDEAAERVMIGNMIGTVKYYFDQIKLPETDRSLLFKVKPVPDFATERASVVTGGASAFTSFFEESSTREEGEMSFAKPMRIARDPRFRLHGKDGKVGLTMGVGKGDDEWKMRHDMFGRRML